MRMAAFVKQRTGPVNRRSAGPRQFASANARTMGATPDSGPFPAVQKLEFPFFVLVRALKFSCCVRLRAKREPFCRQKDKIRLSESLFELSNRAFQNPSGGNELISSHFQ
jgi:hypothetical protein